MNMPKIAAVAHCFYLEYLDSVVEILKNIPCDFDIFISCPPGKNETMKRFFGNAFPEKKITVKPVQSRGFDIAPFVCNFREVYPSYDLILKLHAKKTAHIPWLRGWGDYLLRNVSGSPETVKIILKMFGDDPKLGLVYPEIVPSLREELSVDPWQENWSICQELSARLGFHIQRSSPLCFPAGSMFWFRPQALKSLFALSLRSSDFPQGKRILRNGTLAHAVERLLVLIAETSGYSSRAVCFEPYKTVRNESFLGKTRDKLCCEWGRLLDLWGIQS